MTWLSRSLFTSPIPYALCINKKSYLKTMEGNAPEDDYPTGGARIYLHEVDGERFVIITLAENHTTLDLASVYSILVHEATHLMDFIMEHIGEDTPSSEFKAYMMQHLSFNLIASYNKQTKRGN